jgi:predicted dienelactone hydrolase
MWRAAALAVVSTVIGSHTAQADGVAAVRQVVAISEARDADLDVTVWYPTSSVSQMEMLGESVFFEGTPAIRDGGIADGPFPLVVLSHGAGLGGRAEAMSWIAAPLAARGFIVAAPTHPGNTGPDRSAAETMKLWLRPMDISATLDAVLADPFFTTQLDPERIGILGLSMGGHTALATIGARIDPARLAGYCDRPARNVSLCAWVTQSGVDLHAMDMEPAGQDFTDPRIDVAMAIDPALVDVFAPDIFADIEVPVRLVNLGPEEDLPDTLRASGIAQRIPDSVYAIIEDASHFSMFGLCKPAAADIAVEAGIDEPICTDGAAASRNHVHARMIDMAASAFDEALGDRR